MPRNLRNAIFILYSVTAIFAPLFAYLFPGDPPLSLDDAMLKIQSGSFVNYETALGKGAENYQLDVLNDLEDRLAGMAADYPDGSSALVAKFASPFAAQRAFAHMNRLIPHQKEAEKDLWSTHYLSDSGEAIVITHIDTVLILIISDTTARAKERLAALPAIIYNSSPGMGAVLGQQQTEMLMVLLVVYGLLQALIIANLKRWVAMAVIKREADDGSA